MVAATVDLFAMSANAHGAPVDRPLICLRYGAFIRNHGSWPSSVEVIFEHGSWWLSSNRTEGRHKRSCTPSAVGGKRRFVLLVAPDGTRAVWPTRSPALMRSMAWRTHSAERIGRRPKRSSRQTVSTSPRSMRCMALASAGRFRAIPETPVSSNTAAQRVQVSIFVEFLEWDRKERFCPP